MNYFYKNPPKRSFSTVVFSRFLSLLVLCALSACSDAPVSSPASDPGEGPATSTRASAAAEETPPHDAGMNQVPLPDQLQGWFRSDFGTVLAKDPESSRGASTAEPYASHIAAWFSARAEGMVALPPSPAGMPKYVPVALSSFSARGLPSIAFDGVAEALMIPEGSTGADSTTAYVVNLRERDQTGEDRSVSLRSYVVFQRKSDEAKCVFISPIESVPEIDTWVWSEKSTQPPGTLLAPLFDALQLQHVAGVQFEVCEVLVYTGQIDDSALSEMVNYFRGPIAPFPEVDSSSGVVSLFDFESPDSVAAWTVESGIRLKTSATFKDRGQLSLEIVSDAKVVAGTQLERIVKAKIPEGLRDWSEFKGGYLSITVANLEPTAQRFTLELFTGGEKSRKFWNRPEIPPYSVATLLFALGPAFPGALIPSEKEHDIEAKIGLTNIETLQIGLGPDVMGKKHKTGRIFIDSISLVPKGEVPSGPSAVAMADLSKQMVTDLDQAETGLAEISGDQRWLAAEISRLQSEIVQTRLELTQPPVAIPSALRVNFFCYTSPYADITGLERMMALQRIRLNVERLKILARESANTPAQNNEVLLGIASPLTRVFPFDVPFEFRNTRNISLESARNESETTQVVVIPLTEELPDVSITVGDFVSQDGKPYDASNIAVTVVGSVDTSTRLAMRQQPHFYVGWWPDPLLDFLPTVTIPKLKAAAFAITFKTPAAQAPGSFDGQIEVKSRSQTLGSFDVSLKVHDILLPNEGKKSIWGFLRFGNFKPERFKQIPNWENVKFEWADLAAANRFIFSDHYFGSDFDVIERLKDRGQLTWFNLTGQVLTAFDSNIKDPAKDGKWNDYLNGKIEEMRPHYDEAVKRGIIDHAYVYYMDELFKDEWKLAYLEYAASRIRKEFPLIPAHAAIGNQYSYKDWKAAPSINWWIKLTGSYNAADAESAKSAGKKVLWYNCWGEAPLPGNRLEDDLTGERLFHGAMAHKYGIDGFEYWAFGYWNDSQKPIRSGPLTEWLPQNHDVNGSCGGLMYFGGASDQSGNYRPLSSLRVVSFRDGDEDFAMVRLLASAIEKVERADRRTPAEEAWLKDAKRHASVPNSLVADKFHYSDNPQRVEEWRSNLLNCLSSSPVRIAPIAQ